MHNSHITSEPQTKSLQQAQHKIKRYDQLSFNAAPDESGAGVTYHWHCGRLSTAPFESSTYVEFLSMEEAAMVCLCPATFTGRINTFSVSSYDEPFLLCICMQQHRGQGTTSASITHARRLVILSTNQCHRSVFTTDQFVLIILEQPSSPPNCRNARNKTNSETMHCLKN